MQQMHAAPCLYCSWNLWPSHLTFASSLWDIILFHLFPTSDRSSFPIWHPHCLDVLVDHCCCCHHLISFQHFVITLLMTHPFGWMEMPLLCLPQLMTPCGMAPFLLCSMTLTPEHRVWRSSCFGFLIHLGFFGSEVLSWTELASLGPAYLAWLLLMFSHLASYTSNFFCLAHIKQTTSRCLWPILKSHY